MSLETVIKRLEKMMGYHLSDEQKRILKYNNKSQVLVNSCAGAGKTTLLEFECLSHIMTGDFDGSSILGITFSHKARLDMQHKFVDLQKRYLHYFKHPLTTEHPCFSTFHALFYRLLRYLNRYYYNIQSPKVLPVPMKIRDRFGKNPLYRVHIKIPKSLNEPDLFKKIFQLRSALIDRKMSFDGLHSLRSTKKYNVKSLSTDCYDIGTQHTKEFFSDYISIIAAYEQAKHENNQIDFSDMITLLYKRIQDPDVLKVVRRYINNRYTFCFIDEFQDIDDLQWSIIKLILTGSIWKHLMMVGDDDQSIYYFRGSDPNIILNLPHELHHLRIFHLSTNYRTGGNILKTVIPMIKRNQYRFAKHLDTNKPHVGNVTEITRGSFNSSSYALLRNLWDKVEDPDIKNSSIAVLCRFNVDKMFVIDYLANHKRYVRISNRYKLLQYDSIYRTLYEIMKSLYYNRANLIYKNAVHICFRSYRHHMYQVGSAYRKSHRKPVKTISQYIAACEPSSFTPQDRMLRNYEHHILKSHQLISGFQLAEMAIALTDTYYSYMCKKYYISQSKYKQITSYVLDVLDGVDPLGITKFFAKEDKKLKKLLSKRTDRTHVNVITIHQSKGLQFNYVYLFNLRKNFVSKGDLILNHIFSPNISDGSLFNFIFQKYYSKDRYLPFEFDNELKMNHFDFLVPFTNIIGIIRKLPRNVFARTFNSHSISYILDHINNYPVFFADHPKLCRYIHHDAKVIRHHSHNVEEERRLLYVAITRAKEHLYINILPNASLLLSELRIPAKDFDDADDVISKLDFNRKHKDSAILNSYRDHPVKYVDAFGNQDAVPDPFI